MEMTEAIAALVVRTMPGVKFFVITFQDPEGGRKGIDKYGVSMCSNLKQAELFSLLKGIVDKASAGEAPGVTVRVE